MQVKKEKEESPKQKSVSSHPAIRPAETTVNGRFLLGSNGINTNRSPTSRSLELMYTMTLQKDVQHTRGEVVVCTVFQDYIYV
jgi:hypothetical protein